MMAWAAGTELDLDQTAGNRVTGNNQIGCSTWNIALHFFFRGLGAMVVGFVGDSCCHWPNVGTAEGQHLVS